MTRPIAVDCATFRLCKVTADVPYAFNPEASARAAMIFPALLT